MLASIEQAASRSRETPVLAPMLRTTRSTAKPWSPEQLAHAALGRDEVVGVVHVPEERPLLQVVGDDDERHAVGAQHAVRLGREGMRRVDAAHVLEHLVGIQDVAGSVGNGEGRHPGLGHLHASGTELAGQRGARLDGPVLPSHRGERFHEAADAWANFQQVAGRCRMAGEKRETALLDAKTARATEPGEPALRKPFVEVVRHPQPSTAARRSLYIRSQKKPEARSQKPEARSKKQEARRRPPDAACSFWLLTIVRKPFWLLASDPNLAVPSYNPLACHD